MCAIELRAMKWSDTTGVMLLRLFATADIAVRQEKKGLCVAQVSVSCATLQPVYGWS